MSDVVAEAAAVLGVPDVWVVVLFFFFFGKERRLRKRAEPTAARDRSRARTNGRLRGTAPDPFFERLLFSGETIYNNLRIQGGCRRRFAAEQEGRKADDELDRRRWLLLFDQRRTTRTRFFFGIVHSLTLPQLKRRSPSRLNL